VYFVHNLWETLVTRTGDRTGRFSLQDVYERAAAILDAHEEGAAAFVAANHPELYAELHGPDGETFGIEKMRRFCDLLFAVIATANDEHDGHLTILSFTTGWKACYGTVELDNREMGRMDVAALPNYPTLEAALAGVLTGESKLPEYVA
jgi:hypothetical protein